MYSDNKLTALISRKISKLKDKAEEFSVGHNKACRFSMTTKVIYLFTNPDGLVEVEIKSDQKNLGWVYSEDTEFFMMEFGGEPLLIEFEKIRVLVEDKVKEHGKKFSDNPELYHIRKEESGEAYFYLSEEDIKSI